MPTDWALVFLVALFSQKKVGESLTLPGVSYSTEGRDLIRSDNNLQ